MRSVILLQGLFVLALFWCGSSRPAVALCVDEYDAYMWTVPDEDVGNRRPIIIYTPLKPLQENDDWFQVKDVAGRVFWVQKRHVTNKFRCATVKVKAANLRKGPGTQYRRAFNFTLGRFSSFRVLGKKGRWIRVTDHLSRKAWIYRNLVWIQ